MPYFHRDIAVRDTCRDIDSYTSERFFLKPILVLRDKAYCLKDPQLFSCTIAENIAYAMGEPLIMVVFLQF